MQTRALVVCVVAADIAGGNLQFVVSAPPLLLLLEGPFTRLQRDGGGCCTAFVCTCVCTTQSGRGLTCTYAHTHTCGTHPAATILLFLQPTGNGGSSSESSRDSKNFNPLDSVRATAMSAFTTAATAAASSTTASTTTGVRACEGQKIEAAPRRARAHSTLRPPSTPLSVASALVLAASAAAAAAASTTLQAAAPQFACPWKGPWSSLSQSQLSLFHCTIMGRQRRRTGDRERKATEE